MSRDNYSFDYSRDDIEWLADQLADVLVARQEQQQVQIMTIDMLDTLSLDAIASAVAGITDPIGQLKDWLYDVLKKFVDTIINAVTSAWAKFYDNVIAPVLNAISSAISALYDTLSSAMNYLTTAISAIKDALDKVVVQPILDALQWVQNVLPELGNLVSELIDDIYQAFSKIGDKISEIAGKISDTLSSILDNISSTLVEMLSTAGNAISSLISGIGDAVDTIASKIADVAEKVSSTLDNILDTVTDKASSLLSGIADAVSNILDNIRSAASKITSTLSDIVDNIRDRLSDLVSRLSDIVSDAADNIRKAIGSIADKLQDMLNKISNTIGSLASKIVNTLRDIGSKIADIARSVASKLGDIVSSIASRLESLGSKLLELLSRAGNEIEKIIASVTDAAKKLLSGIEDVARKAIHGIQEAATKAIDTVFSAIRSIADKISELASKMTSLIERIGSKLLDIVKKAASEIHSALSSIYDKAIKPLATKITGALTNIGNKASSIITSIVDKVKEIPGAIDSIARKISGAFSTVVNYLKDIGVKIKDILTSIAELFNPMKLVSALGNLLRRAAPDVYQALEATLAGIHSPLDAIKAYPRILGLTMLGLAKIVWYLMPDSVKRFFEHVADAVRTVGDYLMGFVNAIMKFPEWFPHWFYEHIAKPIVDGLRKIGEWIWANLPDNVKTGLVKIGDFFKWLYDQLQEFAKDPKGKILGFLEWLWDKTLGAKDWLMKHVFTPFIHLLGDLWEKLGEVLAKIGEVTVNAFKKIGGPVFNALRDAFEYVSGLVLSGVSIAIDIAKTLLGKIRDFMSDILPYEIGGLAGALLAKVLGKDKVGMVLSFAGPFTLPVILVGRLFEYIIKEAKKVMPLVMQDPVSTMYGVMNLAVLGSAMGMLFTSGFRSLARVLKGVRIKLSALLRPLGVGVGGESDIEVNLGEAIQELTKFMDKIFPDVARYLIIGHMIWWAEPTRAITRYWLTNYLTIELPPMEQTMRSLRRHLTTPLANEYYRIYVEQLRMGGISQRFIDYLYPLPEDLLKIYQGLGPFYDDKLKAIVITDRFGQPRVFPVSLVAEIPTPSELAHMMIRDIILNPRDFAAVMGMHGFTPDVAFMFYLLHFRYPSPEKLASFFWRGVAGELWNPDESYDKNIVELFFKKQKKGTQLPIPKAPKLFNFKSKELFEIMKQYMKWHDYARIPWHPGWPTDNAIIMDLIADIPGKIDLRWMSRWGLFDYWGAYGKTATTTIEDITTSILIANQTASAEPMIKLYNQYLSQRQPVFDVRQFARALQATGLHPYWVPWVTVAETINALSEERTLLRTGFINLFREGLWPLDTLNKLLAGFFTVVFKTAYFDPNDFNWKEVDIEYPVAFLPAESKLLELRALMDKALDIYREAYRRIIRAIAFYTVSVEQGKAILADIVLNINEKFFVKEMERISGKTLALQLDEGYWEAWSTYAKVLQEVEAIERTRFYARYIIWNVLWALRYGYTTQEEAEKWVNDLVQAMNEHPRIRAMIEQAVRFMLFRFYKEISVRAIINKLRSRRISVEEAVRALMDLGFDEKTARLYIDANVYWYTPSIVTYASMLEVVPEALDTVLSIIEHLNLPSDEYLYWVLYLLRQPTRDELTLVRTRIYQLLALGMQPDSLIEMLSEYSIGYEIKNGKLEYVLGQRAKELLAIYEKAKSVFQAFGIAPQEWVLYNLIALMEQQKDLLKAAEKERIPSPTTIASLAEYLVLPEDLVKKTLEEYHVAPEWLPYWLEYIRVKPLKSDYKSLLSTYIRALRYKAVSEDEFKKFLKELAQWGFTPKEIEVVSRRAALEEAIVEAREAARLYIPTPTMLATLSEYMVLPENLIKEVFEQRHVPPEWQSIWLEYIRVRPLKSDFRRLLSAYIRAMRYGIIGRDEVKKFIESLRNWGFTPIEIQVLEKIADLEAAITDAREYIPTPSQLATIAEYVPAARAFIQEVLVKRNVPKEWWPLWIQYVHLRPLSSEVREVIRDIRSLYEYFAVKLDDMEKALRQFIRYGLESEEIALLVYGSQLRAALRAYRELVGTPRQLVSMAEYSPKARRLALAQVYKMIDALPVDPQTKEFLKKMWEEYIRVRPVYDEVRRYITELINDYANGLMTDEELKNELEALKDWGLDDYEIQFYIWLAQRRRVRYAYREMLREMRSQGYFGL